MVFKGVVRLKKLLKKVLSQSEFSKQWIVRWQYFVMFWCSIFFIVDLWFNKAEHSVELCTTLVISIAAVFIPYLAKAYFSKRNEEENKLTRELELNDDLEEFLEDDGR